MTGSARERRRDGRDALGDALHEELARAGVGRDRLLDLAAQPDVERAPGAVRVGGQVEQRLGVDADLAVDDELQAGQAHAAVREPREGEGLLGGADLHHDVDR